MAVDEHQRRSSEIRLSITPRESQEFVERLAYDDDFRTALRDRPLEVMREYRIEVPEELIPSQVELPSHGDVEELLEQMTSLDEYGKGPQSGLPGRIWEKIKRIFRRHKR